RRPRKVTVEVSAGRGCGLEGGPGLSYRPQVGRVLQPIQQSMSERGRARFLAGSMSAVSAALVVAVLLSISIVGGRLLRPFVGSSGSDRKSVVEGKSGELG